ncbi:MAG TPA: DUF4239 domain-containing protein [Terriglobia bacterium]|nr:DUF4239 domain-containing protein [Terriglobia bacterium]
MTTIAIAVFTCTLLVGIVALLELGRRMGLRDLAGPLQGQSGTGAVDAAVFGLMGLLIAFTFSGAASRWEVRRTLIVQEANAISTAYLRLDLLPSSSQTTLRDTFRRYVRSRLAIYQKIPDIDAARAELEQSHTLQNEIWQQAVAAAKQADSPAVLTLVLQPINEMIDITDTRTAALQAHLPFVIFLMLAVTVLASSMLAGYNMGGSGKRSWMHVISYALLVCSAVYLVLELEYPRLGLVRIDGADQILAQTLEGMK